MAPLPVWSVAVEKVVAGALQGSIAAAIVFPLAMFVPATPVHLDVRPGAPAHAARPSPPWAPRRWGWCSAPASIRDRCRSCSGSVVIPIVFLGATYYPWANLTPIPWLKAVVLLNPLVYMSEGMRIVADAAGPRTCPYWAIYGGMIGFSACFLALGIDGFRKRVLS